MPKKWELFGKKEEALLKRKEQKGQSQQKAQQAKEDAYWHDEGDKNMQKKAARQEEEEEKKIAVQMARQEKEKLMLEEEKEYEMAKVSATAKKAGQGKKAKAYDAAEAQRKALLKSMAKLAVAEEENAEEGDLIQDITPVEEPPAIIETLVVKELLSSQFIASEKQQPDRHPEKRRKAAY